MSELATSGSPALSDIGPLVEAAVRREVPALSAPVLRSDLAIAVAVLRHELATTLRTTIAWLLPLAALVAVVCALQPAFAAGPLAAKLDALPQVLRDALGIAQLDFHRPAAYLATNFTYVGLGTALFGGLVGARAIAKEEVRHTAELLYAQPARRGAILAGKAAAVALYVLVLPAALAVIAMGMLAAIVDAPLEPALVASLFAGAAAASAAFAGLGLLIAATAPARLAASLTVGLVLGTFVVGMIGAALPALQPLRLVSPHKLVEATRIVARGGLDPRAALALVGIGLAGAVLAIARYRRRDLHA